MKSRAEYARTYRAKKLSINPNYIKEINVKRKRYNKSYQERMQWIKEGRGLYLYWQVRTKQKDSDITLDWLEEKVLIGKCELTGILFEYDRRGNKAFKAPSIDRIDSSKGYYKDNCQLILTWLNIGKGNMPIEYFKQLIKELKDSD